MLSRYRGAAKYWPWKEGENIWYFSPLPNEGAADRWMKKHSEHALEVWAYEGDTVVQHHTPEDAEKKKRERSSKYV